MKSSNNVTNKLIITNRGKIIKLDDIWWWTLNIRQCTIYIYIQTLFCTMETACFFLNAWTGAWFNNGVVLDTIECDCPQKRTHATNLAWSWLHLPIDKLYFRNQESYANTSVLSKIWAFFRFNIHTNFLSNKFKDESCLAFLLLLWRKQLARHSTIQAEEDSNFHGMVNTTRKRTIGPAQK